MPGCAVRYMPASGSKWFMHLSQLRRCRCQSVLLFAARRFYTTKPAKGPDSRQDTTCLTSHMRKARTVCAGRQRSCDHF